MANFWLGLAQKVDLTPKLLDELLRDAEAQSDAIGV